MSDLGQQDEQSEETDRDGCKFGQESGTGPDKRGRLTDHPVVVEQVMKLLMSDYEVTLVEDNMQDFYVRFIGPTETPFVGGIWKVHVDLPDQYPYKSPSIGFFNKIFHPNIDEM